MRLLETIRRDVEQQRRVVEMQTTKLAILEKELAQAKEYALNG